MSELPVDIRRIETRLQAVHAVGGIVRAIWALSQAQLAQVDAFSRHASSYLDQIDEIVERLTGPFSPDPRRDTLHVVLGPERPFCGGLPLEIARKVPAKVPLGVCGNRLLESLAQANERRAQVVFAVPGPSSVDDLELAAERLAHETLRHGRDRHVVLLYSDAHTKRLRDVTLLSSPRSPRTAADFETYTPIERLLEVAVVQSVTGRLLVGLAESLRSEVRARAAAAETARHGVERQQSALSSALRVLSQEQVTTELGELFAGQFLRGDLR